MSIFSKAKKFFAKSPEKQRQKIEKLEAIVAKLVVKADSLMKRYDKEQSDAKKERLIKEHKAVKKLLRKSRRRLESLKETSGA